MNSNLDFPTTETYTKEDVKRVQSRLLEMAKITTEILEHNGFHYMIAFGTLLGAVRHQGFIPWDDDFDLFLFDEEYDAAVECLRHELPDDIIVHDKKTDPIYWPAWSRLRDLNSKTEAVLFPDDNAYKYTGINLDLYRLKKINRSEVPANHKRENIEFLVRKHDSGLIDEATYLRLFHEWTSDYVELCKNTNPIIDGEEVYSFVLLLKQAKIQDIFPLQQYTFEGIEFWGPNNSHAILSQCYGDYMKIPEYDSRRPHYSYVKQK